MKRLLFAAAMAAAIAVPVAGAAKSPPAAPMTGEFLSALEPSFPTHEVDMNANCAADGSGVVTFTASGTAFGPYPGTFTESGIYEFGPRNPVTGRSVITRIEVEFTIFAVNATITGHKSLHEGTFFTSCFDSPGGEFGGGVYPTRYTATIVTDAGTFRDEGETFGEFQGGPQIEVAPGFIRPEGLAQGFFSSLTALVPVKPGKGCGDKNHEHEREAECRKVAR